MKPQSVKRKKPYVRPALVRYGTLRQLTGAKSGTADDGTGKPTTRATGPKT